MSTQGTTTSLKSKYIESHWLVFAIKGAFAAVAGLCIAITNNTDSKLLAQIVAWTMFGLAFVEVANVVRRKRFQHNWGFPLAVGIIQLFVSIMLLYTIDPSVVADHNAFARFPILSAYTIYASIMSIVIGFSSFENITDRITWLIEGIIGSIIGVVMFAHGALDSTFPLSLFGTYLIVKGITDLMFGVHSFERSVALKEERAAIRAAKAELRSELADQSSASEKKATKKGKQ
ncbi:DUF308 domain-containing protein [Candidatus Saccharibacteria bacterium]|nr:DUF308 domain-containing protein [Candidatus Saccharibacteria bacterium]